MKQSATLSRTRSTRVTRAAAATAAAVLFASGCAGGAGGGDAGGSGDGFEYGAEQDEVDAVLADLEPVEIVYQAGAQSPNSISAISATSFKEYIEERSGGKITVDLVWGQAIAGYGEVDDALADGRVDIAYTLPIYNPAEYAAFNALSTASAGMPNTLLLGELIGNAAVVELGWGSEELLAEYEAKGLTPLTPMVSTGTYTSICKEAGSSLDDWRGRQVRIASVAHQEQVSNLGASPVSMEYVEVFEALQRGTVDCTLAQLLPSEESGLLEVGTHVAYTPAETSLSGRAAGANVAGIGYQNLPLPYKQIIFDASAPGLGASTELVVDGNVAGVEQLLNAGGEIVEMGDDSAARIGETNDELLADIEESGVIGSGVGDRVSEVVEKWTGIAEELGYEDGGGFEDMPDWYQPGDVDFGPIGERIYEEVVVQHRPS